MNRAMQVLVKIARLISCKSVIAGRIEKKNFVAVGNLIPYQVLKELLAAKGFAIANSIAGTTGAKIFVMPVLVSLVQLIQRQFKIVRVGKKTRKPL